MSAENPFSTPATESEAGTVETRNSLGSIARSTFLAWEKLRVIYLAILGIATLLMALLDGWKMVSEFEFWLILIQGAVVTNLGYFAGPVVDTYVSWLGLRSNWLRPTLFILGTVFSVGMAIAILGVRFLITAQ